MMEVTGLGAWIRLSAGVPDSDAAQQARSVWPPALGRIPRGLGDLSGCSRAERGKREGADPFEPAPQWRRGGSNP